MSQTQWGEVSLAWECNVYAPCALLRPFVLFCALLCSVALISALLRSLECFCVRPCLERPRFGTSDWRRMIQKGEDLLRLRFGDLMKRTPEVDACNF